MKKCLLFVFLSCSFVTFAADNRVPMTPTDYIDNFKDDAVKEMLIYNIPASITLAQGMLESNYGNSPLAVNANNHFGIKCHKEWGGPSFIQDDDEKNECFRKYNDPLESFSDHSVFLKSRDRYASLFELRRTNYKEWAKGLKEAGYATDPRYPVRLIDIIETYKLYKFDEVTDLSGTAIPPKKMTPAKSKVKVAIAGKEEEREILRMNMIKYIAVKPGDSFDKIAKETDKDLWQIYKFNELTEKSKLQVGQVIFLQPKHKRAQEPYHIVRKGETMHSISQMHGMKLRSLYKMNGLKPGEEPKVGDTLYLRKSKPSS
jgi:LysM repeat protein